MDQSLRRQSVTFAPPVAPDSLPVPHVPAGPSSRGRAFHRATAVLAQAGQRLAVVARRLGQPADTFSGSEAMNPDDIRARFMIGVYRTPDAPRSLRDSDRRW